MAPQRARLIRTTANYSTELTPPLNRKHRLTPQRISAVFAMGIGGNQLNAKAEARQNAPESAAHSSAANRARTLARHTQESEQGTRLPRQEAGRVVYVRLQASREE